LTGEGRPLLNLLPLLAPELRNPSAGLDGRPPKGRPPKADPGLPPALTELGPLERVAEVKPDGITEATSLCGGGGGGGGRAVNAGIYGAIVVET
jgi:hypothetical protein